MRIPIAGLQDVWQHSTGSRRITVAILDTAIDLRHPFLSHASILQVNGEGKPLSGETPLPHGLRIAAILAGRDPEGSYQGIAPDCRILSIPIWEAPQGQFAPCSQERLADAIRLAVGMGAHVINVSGGQLLNDREPELTLLDAVREATERGVLIVAAAGNDGCDCGHIPAMVPEVLAVGAMDASGQPLAFSNWTESYRGSGILAPGEAIAAPQSDGREIGTVTGTSYAAAVVSGIAALLLSIQVKSGESPQPLRIRDLLLETAEPCPLERHNQSGRCLAGRLNPAAALESAIPAAVHPSGLSVGGLPDADSPAAEIATHEASKNDTNQQEVQMSELNLPPSAERVEALETGVAPSDGGCGCGCKGGPAQLVYAIGSLGVDFGTKLHQQSFAADMAAGGFGANPLDAGALLSFLDAQPYAAADLTWTLLIDGVPVYALAPMGPFSAQGYELLRKLLKEQTAASENLPPRLLSVPGVIAGTATLLHSHQVPVIRPALRGVYPWSSESLLEKVMAGVPANEADARRAQFTNFLDRFFYELRNLGRTPSERAINFAGTAVFRMGEAFAAKIREDLVLARIEVARASVCQPGGDCWDVSLYFFHPQKMLERARDVFRFTVDVSGELPQQVGKVNAWSTHAGVL